MGKNSQLEKTGSGTISINPILREFSSGGVVYKKIGSETLWLVAATNPSKQYPELYWRLPKGWIDNSSPDTPGPIASGKVKAKDATLRLAALREVREEGGVKANIVKKIGTVKFVYTNHARGRVLKFVTFYLMEWESDLPGGHDNETSEVLWLTFKMALEKLSFGREKDILQKANELLASVA